MSYDVDGFHIHAGLVPKHRLDRLTAAFGEFCRMQRCKTRRASLTDPMLSAAARMLEHSPAGFALAAEPNLIMLAAGLLEAKPDQLVVAGPSVFINPPGSTTRLYTWHAERHWYPMRRNFVNLWLPLTPKHARNGTMMVSPGSHKRAWDFTVYPGYEESGSAGLLQYEIPAAHLDGLPRQHVVADVGDVVAFHPGLVHRSTENEDSEASLAVTLRVFDYSGDLTLSGDWADRPYRTDAAPMGFPNITVRA